MASIDTIADRSSGTAVAGKAYFETSTNKFIVYNGSSWVVFDAAPAGFNISTQDTEANIISSSPTNPSGEVTLAYATDTGRLCVYDGLDWLIYDNNLTI